MPLLVWWDSQKGERPLSSWKHVQGYLERETIYGWLVRGTIEGQSGLQYFLLKNPPRDELEKYRELVALLPQLEQERTGHLETTKLPEYQGWNWDAYGGVARMPTDDFDRIQKAKADLREVDARIGTVRQDIEKMLDPRGYFAVDGFALQMNELYQGSPVFDFGYPTY